MTTSATHTTTGASRSARADVEIQEDVLAELRWDARVSPNEIGVIVKDGVVTLTGWVDSYAKRWAAEQAARRVRGVRGIANDVEVRLPDSDQRPDGEIAAAALHALEWDALIPTDKIKVTVVKGWVSLEGEVEWQYQKRDAERVVRRLKGVTGVSNMIVVRPRVTPSQVKKSIEEALVRSVRTDASRITVETEDGKVMLRGTVRSWAEREEAERAAWLAPGVTSVDNHITVAYTA